MAAAISTGSRADLKVLEKRPVTFFSRVFSKLSKKPNGVPCLVAKYKFIGDSFSSIEMLENTLKPRTNYVVQVFFWLFTRI
jgi:hypothetical protein